MLVNITLLCIGKCIQPIINDKNLNSDTEKLFGDVLLALPII